MGTDGKFTATGRGKVKGDAGGVQIDVSEIGYVHLCCLKVERISMSGYVPSS